MNYRVGLVLILVFGSCLAFGQGNYTLQLTGGWNNASNWTGSGDSPNDGIPDADDNVIIPNGLRVDITTTVACLALTLNGTGRVDFSNNGFTLTVNGVLTMNGNSSITGNSNTRILSLQNDFIVSAGATGTMGGMQVTQNTSKNFTVSGTFIPSDNTGTKSVGNVIINNGGLWSATSTETFSTQNFTGYEGGRITGSSTSVITVNGNFVVNTSAPSGSQFRVGQISLTVNGTSTINGYLQFSASAAGTKTFRNTITVNSGGTWDNTVGEDPVVNCSIVNNGLWPVPTGGNGTYVVNNGGVFNYSGLTEIGMTQLRVQSASVVTNVGQLALTKTGNNGLSVEGGSTFNNGTGGYLRLVSSTDPIDLNGGGSTINFTATNNTVDYNFAGNQTVEATTYDRLIINNGSTKTLSGLTTVNSSVTINGSSILDAQSNQLTGAANLIMNGTSTLRIQRTGVTVPELTGTSNTLAAGTTIEFYGAAAFTLRSSANLPYQDVSISGNSGSNANFSQVTNIAGNLSFTNVGRMSSNVALTVAGTTTYSSSATTTLAANVTTSSFIISNGTLNTATNKVIINGNGGTLTNNGATSLTAANFEFQTGTNQKIDGSTNSVVNNIIVNNANGVTVETSAATPTLTVNGNLSFPSGNLKTTGTNVIIMAAAATITPLPGFVEGNLRKPVATGAPTRLFEVGSGSNYSPMQLAFASVTVAGSVTVSSTTPDHPELPGAHIVVNSTVNRYWSLINNAVTFTGLTATVTYVDAEKDGPFSPLSVATVVKFYNNSTFAWTAPTMGTRNLNDTSCTGLTSTTLTSGVTFDFVVGGDIDPTFVFNRVNTGNWHTASSWSQGRTGVVVFTEGQVSVPGTSTLFTTELVPGDNLVRITQPALASLTIASVTSDTQLTLTAPYAGPYNGGVAPNRTYTGNIGREHVPNGSTEIVVIGNPNLTDATTTITLDASATILELTLGSAKAFAHTLTHTGTASLTVQADVSIEQPTGNVTHSWDILNGTASVTGTLAVGGLTNNTSRIARVRIQNGTLNTRGVNYITPNNNGTQVVAVVDMSSGNGTWNRGGLMTFANNRGTLLSNTGSPGSTVNFNRTSGSQILIFPSTAPTAFAYHNVKANNSTELDVVNDIATTGNYIVTGNIAVESGNMIVGSNTIAGAAGKTFSVSPGATFRMEGNTGFPSGFGTFDLGTTGALGTVQFAQTNNQTVPAITTGSPAGYGNLEILGSANQTFTLANALVTVQGNLTIGDGTTTPDLNGGGTSSRLDVNGNMIINTGSTLDASSMTNSFPTNTAIQLAGSWTDNSTVGFTADDAAVTFDGSGTQNIGGTSSETFYRVLINSTGPVQLTNSTTVSNLLRLTAGQLNLNNQTLSITNAATTAIDRTSGYIRSESESSVVRWSTSNITGNFVFPFGKSASEYIPFNFNITGAGSPATGSMSISTYGTGANNTPYPTGVTNLNGTSGGTSVVDRFWVITPNSYTTTRPTANLTFTATDAEIATTAFNPESGTVTYTGTPPGLAAQRWSPANYWDNATTPQTFTSNLPAANTAQVVLNGVNNFSPWALADQSFALPIELVSFDATPNKGEVVLMWTTASELNNDYFVVERSASGEDFSEVARVAGAGTTTRTKRYRSDDGSPLPGVSYYRLRQIDFDGRFSYSKVVRVEINASEFWTITPNPTQGERFNVRFAVTQLQPVAVQVLDVSGRTVYQSEFGSGNEFEIEPPHKLAAGVYIVVVFTANQVSHQRMVVK